MAWYKELIEAFAIVLWSAWVGKSLVKQYSTWKKMFEWPEPDRWPKMVRHTEINYCEECDPPPQPHEGEIMFCPKCDRPMAHHKVTTAVGNGTESHLEVRQDWFCADCRETWMDGAARKYQTNWHREQTRKDYANRQVFARATETAGWSSYHIAGSTAGIGAPNFGTALYPPDIFEPEIIRNVYTPLGRNKQFFQYNPLPLEDDKKISDLAHEIPISPVKDEPVIDRGW